MRLGLDGMKLAWALFASTAGRVGHGLVLQERPCTFLMDFRRAATAAAGRQLNMGSRRRTIRCSLSTNAPSTITTVAQEHTAEEIVKKSRFVATCFPAASWIDAKDFLGRIGDPRARHNCWAWVGANTARSSDDGEPSGTAGRPILNAIEGEELANVVVMVTRYKASDAPQLGAAGLLRAYGSAARLTLRGADKVSVVPTTELLVKAPLSELGNMQQVLAKWEKLGEGSGRLSRAGEDYGGGDSVTFTIIIEHAFADAFAASVQEASSGRGEVSLPSGGDDDSNS